MNDLRACPQGQCNQAAEIERQDVLESTDGPVEHVKVRCLVGHWFYMPTAMLRV